MWKPDVQKWITKCCRSSFDVKLPVQREGWFSWVCHQPQWFSDFRRRALNASVGVQILRAIKMFMWRKQFIRERLNKKISGMSPSSVEPCIIIIVVIGVASIKFTNLPRVAFPILMTICFHVSPKRYQWFYQNKIVESRSWTMTSGWGWAKLWPKTMKWCGSSEMRLFYHTKLAIF